MAELGPKNKHKVSAKSLANLRPSASVWVYLDISFHSLE
jgi:hypothetical protein